MSKIYLYELIDNPNKKFKAQTEIRMYYLTRFGTLKGFDEWIKNNIKHIDRIDISDKYHKTILGKRFGE